MKKLPDWNKPIFLQIMHEENKYFDSDKLLDDVLKTDPGFTLSENFATLIAEKVSRKFAWSQYLKEFLIYLSAILGIILVTAIMVFIWFDANLANWLTFFSSNLITILGINVLVVFILFADRVLLRYFMYKSSQESE